MSVTFSQREHMALVSLHRPEAANAIDDEMAAELESICRQVNQDSDLRVVVITGAGNSFCTGGNFNLERYHPAAAIAGIELPVIAAISGDAIGEGLEIALACDIRLSTKQAHFGLPQITGGRMPLDGGTQRLPRIVGKGKALEMLFTGDLIDAREAYAIGLVNRICDDLNLEADALAVSIAGKGPIAARFVKEAVNKGLELTLEQGMRLEADLYFLLHTTADRTEGVRAFLEKRPPDFKGR